MTNNYVLTEDIYIHRLYLAMVNIAKQSMCIVTSNLYLNQNTPGVKKVVAKN